MRLPWKKGVVSERENQCDVWAWSWGDSIWNLMEDCEWSREDQEKTLGFVLFMGRKVNRKSNERRMELMENGSEWGRETNGELLLMDYQIDWVSSDHVKCCLHLSFNYLSEIW